MANVPKKKFNRSRKYKKKPSEKMANIKAKSYSATPAKNKNAISTVAKRLASLEKKTNLLQIRNTYYTSNNYRWAVLNANLAFGVLDLQLINQPLDMTPALNYDGQLSPATMGRHIGSRINVRATLISNHFRPVFLNVVILKLKKSAYNQVLLRSGAGSGLASPSSWEAGRELHREIGLTNGTTLFSGMNQVFWNPKFFKVVSERRLRISNTSSTAGFRPYSNYDECVIELKVGQTYKKKSYTSTAPPVDTSWTSVDGFDNETQYYMVIYHEGFDEIQHSTGLNVEINTEMRHVIKQQVEKN